MNDASLPSADSVNGFLKERNCHPKVECISVDTCRYRCTLNSGASALQNLVCCECAALITLISKGWGDFPLEKVFVVYLRLLERSKTLALAQVFDLQCILRVDVLVPSYP